MKQNEAKEQDDIIGQQIQHYEHGLYIKKGYFDIFISLMYCVKKIILKIFDIQNNDHQKLQESQRYYFVQLPNEQRKGVRTLYKGPYQQGL